MFLVESMEPWDKNGGMTKAMHRKLTKNNAKDVELFQNGTVHDFYRLKALITLEQVITSVVEKKKNLNEQNDFHHMLF